MAGRQGDTASRTALNRLGQASGEGLAQRLDQDLHSPA
jgi:hypothetical protein